MNENLLAILAAREARAATQKALLEKYRKPLLCFTLNIPGPEKFNRDVSIAFFVGNRLLQDALRGIRVLYRQNASWQGRVVWREESRSETFRSALELLFLMHSALDGAECG